MDSFLEAAISFNLDLKYFISMSLMRIEIFVPSFAVNALRTRTIYKILILNGSQGIYLIPCPQWTFNMEFT